VLIIFIYNLVRVHDIHNCKDLQEAGRNLSGIYDIHLLSSNSKVSVYCDQETDGGGWLVSSIVIQSNIYIELIIIIFVYCFQSSATKK